MSVSVVPTSAPASAPRTTDIMRLHGRWLVGLRVGWVAIVLPYLAVFLASIPVAYAQLRGICPPPPLQGCENAPTPGNILALHRLGLSLDLYALGSLSLVLISAVLFMVVGAVIFWRKSTERLGLFVSLWLIVFGASLIADAQIGTQALAQTPQLVRFVFPYMEGAIWPGLILFLCLFPDGRFIPQWSWLWVVLALVIAVLPADSAFNPPHWPLPLFVAAEALTLGSPVGFQVYRYLRVSDAVGRQQTKWFVFGVGTGVVSALILHGLEGVFPSDSPYQLLTRAFGLFLISFPIPFAIGIAILRYRLWDIDTIINKALVYGLLTALLGALYASLIIGLERLASLLTGQSSDRPVVLVISTLAIAALFQPLRHRLQSLIDRRFYRRKYDAAKTLAAFSATLRNEVDLEQVRTQLLAGVQEAMQPANVSLWLRAPERHAQPGAWRRTGAAAGTTGTRPPTPASAGDPQNSAQEDHS